MFVFVSNRVPMQFFTKSFFKFFDELENNNNKVWFDANRHLYEEHVKQPFKELVTSVTEKLAKDLPEINRNIPKAIFRINKDIRFSKDKSPYKNNVAAVFSKIGTQDMEYPGFYIHIGSKEIFVGGGMYMLDKAQLAKIRQEIYYNPDAFKKVINEKGFKSVYGELKGDKNKVLEPDYKEFAKEQPLIANKSFYYMVELKKADAMVDGFDEILYKQYFKPAYKFNAFLINALRND
jgi:uncharacterized protein (TIGR02453 family)